MRETVLFLRNRPAEFNLGDFLCTPMHFFNFGVRAIQVAPSLCKRPQKVVIGGGAYNDLGLSNILDPYNTICWGVGSSVHGNDTAPTNADGLPYRLYGVRDIDAISDKKYFVPCVTCLHPIAHTIPGRSIGVFLNKDKFITQTKPINLLRTLERRGVVIGWNNVSEYNFTKKFSVVDRVITNSFHVAYWSLLSGRKVAIIGYSSKFRSLVKMTGLAENSILPFDPTVPESLFEQIENAIKFELFIQSLDHQSLRKSCIEKNIDFARNSVKIGFFPKAELKSQNWMTVVGRQINYAPIQFAQRFLLR